MNGNCFSKILSGYLYGDRAMDDRVYGVIFEKGEGYYTYLNNIFDGINNIQKEYLQRKNFGK